MRALIAIACVVLAGCFNPKTKSCQFQCAAQGTACPSGFACVSGLCVAPGETCGGDDGPPPPPLCGDHIRAAGEVCYGNPMIFDGGDVTYDAQLADMDGDGLLDLVYLIGDQYKYQTQSGGVISATAQNGPTVFATYMRALNLNASPQAELFDAGMMNITDWLQPSPGSFTMVGTLSVTPPADPLGTAVAHITSDANPCIAVISTMTLSVFCFGGGLVPSQFYAVALTTGHDVAAGPLDDDALADVVTATTTGIKFHRALVTGLAPATTTSVTTNVDGIAVGDVNADGKVDVVYSVIGATGQLGVMRSLGGGAFGLPATLDVPNLAAPIESADIDGDGHADVIGIRNGVTHAVVVSLAQADGTLSMPIEIPISVAASYLHVDADLNGDGVPEIVVTDPNTQTMIVLSSNP
jgi:hypothetical protein